jgi:uncharacterized membrane protein YsdA (DUF1294 family)
VQIRAFPFYQRRPKKSDSVSFRQGKDADGRRVAATARLQGLLASAGAFQLLFFLAVAVVFSVALARDWLEICPNSVALELYALVCPFTFAAYLWDKQKAVTNGYRVPEKVLHLLELFGGWPAALVAQRSFRHKIRKVRYQLVFWAIVLLHLSFWTRSFWLPLLVGHAP